MHVYVNVPVFVEVAIPSGDVELPVAELTPDVASVPAQVQGNAFPDSTLAQVAVAVGIVLSNTIVVIFLVLFMLFNNESLAHAVILYIPSKNNVVFTTSEYEIPLPVAKV